MQIAIWIIGGSIVVLSAMVQEKLPPQLRMIAWICLLIFAIAYAAMGIVLERRTRKREKKSEEREEKSAKGLEQLQVQMEILLKQVSIPAITKDESVKLVEVLGQLEKRLAAPDIDKTKKLKLEASYLSTQILQFLADRAQAEPPLPKHETWSQDVDRMLRFSTDTRNQYYIRFGSKVIAMKNQLAEMGLHDEELDRFCDDPVNPIGMRIVALRIGTLVTPPGLY